MNIKKIMDILNDIDTYTSKTVKITKKTSIESNIGGQHTQEITNISGSVGNVSTPTQEDIIKDHSTEDNFPENNFTEEDEENPS